MFAAPAVARAQDRGAAALANAIALLRHDVPRVLYIAAHPDDEDTQLITWLSRGGYADVAYLSLTRGDGGQNLIGDELGEALGVLRTQELLAARRIDGARQYFTRAYDFGFSKSAEETYGHWPHDSLLNDVITVVRMFRPHVIATTFSGTPRDGHGQHQVSALLAREAYDVADDTVRFPPAKFGAPWRPLKLYRFARFSGVPPTLRINVGEYDPLAGRSYAEVAAESRSQHKSQGFGTIQRKGVVWATFRREHSRVNEATAPEAEQSIFDGLRVPPTAARGTDGDRALPADVRRPETALPVISAFEPRDLWERRRRDRAAALASGIAVEALAERESVAVGDSVKVTYAAYNRGTRPIRIVRGNGVPTDTAVLAWIAPDSVARWSGFVRGEHVTQPWWLVPARTTDLFAPRIDERPEDEREGGEWFHVRYEVSGMRGEAESSSPIVFRFADPVRGEVQRPLAVAPGLTVTFAREASVARAGIALDREVVVIVRSSFSSERRVVVQLQTPTWVLVTPSAVPIDLAAGATRSVVFRLEGVLPQAVSTIRAVARTGAETFSAGVQLVEYDHIVPQRIYRPAELRLSAADVRIPTGMTVAYVPSVQDVAPEVLRELGVQVVIVPAEELPRTDLSRFSAVVLGPRAYEANPLLIEHNQRLLDYAAAGGRLVVQYGQYEMMRPGVMPYPITIARPHDRVTDEAAPVMVLDSAARELRAPNVIGARDFDGWLQDRAMYMPREIDPRYRTMLSMNDPGESPNRGAILVAPIGRGTYVYTTLALFRQLRAGVPGAVRLFANLITPDSMASTR